MPNGYRKYKTVNGTTKKFLWDEDYIAVELDNSSNVTNTLYRGINLIKDSQGNNYVYDNHGDVTNILNDSGTTTKKYEYNSYGIVESETNANTYNPWQYCGEYRDQESGLIYLRNRYYDSDTGRFINEDPARSGINWYSYCGGNPMMFFDLFGLEPEHIVELAKDVAETSGGNYEFTEYDYIDENGNTHKGVTLNIYGVCLI